MQTYRLAGDLRLRYTLENANTWLRPFANPMPRMEGGGPSERYRLSIEHFWAFLASAPPPGDPPPYPKPFQDQYTKILRIYTTGELRR